ncbi:MAG TPA: Rrf2 family transcriptional regulator [Blastocatellia bacterium]|nr:Rrf2 family transcriptional regulator [Blastocatellia bacterium]
MRTPISRVRCVTAYDITPKTPTAADNTSEWMAGSIGVNPVIVRNVTGMLRRAGLAVTRQGVAGASLSRKPADITLLDVYRAVEPDGEMFSIHSRPNPKCPVGAKIESTLEKHFTAAQQAMEARLANTSRLSNQQWACRLA